MSENVIDNWPVIWRTFEKRSSKPTVSRPR